MKHISNKGISLLKSFEGCSLVAFFDVSGYAIGYGHHGDVKEGDTITPAKAEEILRQDLADRYEPCVNKYDSVYNFNQNEFDALVSFCYNCGVGNLSRLLKNGQATREQIRDALPKYNKAGGKVLNGLVKRRNAELALFNETVSKSDKYYPRYTGTSQRIDDILKAIGAPFGNWKVRTPLANANGITGYTGSYAQNINIINKAKAGTLRRG